MDDRARLILQLRLIAATYHSELQRLEGEPLELFLERVETLLDQLEAYASRYPEARELYVSLRGELREGDNPKRRLDGPGWRIMGRGELQSVIVLFAIPMLQHLAGFVAS